MIVPCFFITLIRNAKTIFKMKIHTVEVFFISHCMYVEPIGHLQTVVPHLSPSFCWSFGVNALCPLM